VEQLIAILARREIVAFSLELFPDGAYPLLYL
jgi:hypothetical protein